MNSLNKSFSLKKNIQIAQNELLLLGFEEAYLEIELLIEKIYNLPFRLCLKKYTYLSKDQYTLFKNMVDKRKKKYPIAYITHQKAFFDFNYYIPYKVFIPRSETEQLVEKAIQLIKKVKPEAVIDVGCGSGVIACEIAKSFPNLKVYAFDISKNAIKATQMNAHNQSITNIEILNENFFMDKNFKYLSQLNTFLISNPPYISTNEKSLMGEDVLLHEPKKALYATKKGFSVILKLLDLCIFYKTHCLLEIGYRQSRFLKKKYSEDLVFYKDYENIERFCYFFPNQ